MTELEKAIAIISAASGAEATVVAEQLTSDEAPATAAVKLFEVKFSEQRDQGDQRATKKTRTEVEKALKDAGVPDAKFSDLPAAIQALKASAATEAGKGITPEQALAHEAVKSKINELTASIDTKVAAGRAEERTAFEKERTLFEQGKIASRKAVLADSELDIIKPLLGDEKKAPGRRAELIDRLSKLPTIEVNGELFEADANGDIKPNTLGNPVKYADMVRRETERLYDLPVSTPKESPHVTQQQVAANPTAFAFKEFKGTPPKNEAEFETLVNDTSLSPAAVKELMDFRTAEKAAK